MGELQEVREKLLHAELALTQSRDQIADLRGPEGAERSNPSVCVIVMSSNNY